VLLKPIIALEIQHAHQQEKKSTPYHLPTGEGQTDTPINQHNQGEIMTARIEKTVFISYRHTNYWTALAVFQNLNANGYDVFLDYKSIPSGDFEQVITENVKSRAHFIVILSPSALERCNKPGDWLRREIETAIDSKRNIIPLMMEGFGFGNPATEKALTGKLTDLKKYNAMSIPAEYFDEAMIKLRSDRFLNRPLEFVLHPVSEITRQITEEQKSAAKDAPQVEKGRLTAQVWFERGKKLSSDEQLEDAVQAFGKATELDLDLADAWENKSQLLIKLGRKKEASEAITRLIGLYEKQIEIAEAQYDSARDLWTSQAENDRLFGNQSISMSDYYDTEVLASHRGYLDIDTELRDKIRSLKTLRNNLQPSE
jgi:tetratricopeptide (TPR) repeat protein